MTPQDSAADLVASAVSVPTDDVEAVTAGAEESTDVETPAAESGEARPRRRSTSHLKVVPETLALRERIRRAAETFAGQLDKSEPFTRAQLEAWGRQLLDQLELPEKYLGFTCVLIGNYFWKQQFLAVPFERRMLLLPHCLKHAEGCPAEYDEFGLDCEKCGACSIADYKVRAEQLGYKVLVAEGSPIVLKIIVSGYVDGILGVACLNVLEKAIDKVLLASVPSFAVPLHSGDCLNTSLDESWVWEVLDKYEPQPEEKTNSFLPVLRRANALFDEHFDRLLPRIRSRADHGRGTPIAQTEEIAYDWLANGGKRFRPFITLAAYEAMTARGDDVSGRGGARSDEPAAGHDTARAVGDGLPYPEAVCRVAMAIEAFHKASLVHDDIEDDDLYRYGRKTLHRQYDVGTAINVGDYLIGVGYRLVNAARGFADPSAVCDILDRMASAHIKLCDGQGAEMAWQSRPSLEFSPLDALQIYALKTSPAFEAALYAGVRLAGDVKPYEETISQFCRHLGVGFQILNDLKDWRGDANNKLVAGQDAIALRPTLLLALAIQSADDRQRTQLQELIGTSEVPPQQRLQRLRTLFTECGAFEKAEALVQKSRQRAEQLADDVEPEEFRRLLYFLVDTVLAPEDAPADSAPPAPIVPLSMPVGVPR
ncbi:MAG: DUF116 domain-containing protein [Planctomycetota bacterium]|nr:MAG: DUF116 domain-containing protein [Planctomycetota bacterium]